jgi:copper transport protein
MALAAVAVVSAVALAVVLAAAPPAEAHARLQSSDPRAGSTVHEAPAAITLRFSQPPDVAISSVEVVDTEGRSFTAGPPEPAPGENERVFVPLRPLAAGVHVVNWRTVSRVDGDLATGSFTFAVRAPVTQGAGVHQALGTPPVSPLGVAGRALFYAGLAALLGAAWIQLFVIRERVWALVLIAYWGWLLATVGMLAVMQSRRSAAGIDIATFMSSSHGRSMALRMGPLLIAGIGVLLDARGWSRWRGGAPAMAGVGALGVILGHVASGHAAAGRNSGLMIGLQWAHFAAVGLWIGGLLALLVSLRGRSGQPAADAVRRFSTGAGVALAVVAVTGLVRAVSQVGGWRLIQGSSYGRLVLVKVSLLIVLAAFGAINRYRNVPAAAASLRGLRRLGTSEVAIAVVVVMVTGLLAETAPPPPRRPPLASSAAVAGADLRAGPRAQVVPAPGAVDPTCSRPGKHSTTAATHPERP